MSRRRSPALLASAALLVALWSGGAGADGAFPAGFSVFFPPQRPDTLVLATTFGLVQSGDAGKTWTYACEDPERARDGRFYNFSQEGAVERIFTVGLQGLAYTEDSGCTWATTPAATDNLVASDYFIDPSNPRRVAVLAESFGAEGRGSALYLSEDAGRTLGAPYESKGSFASVEIAASDPRTIYAIEDIVGMASRFVRSTDGGQNWSSDVLPMAEGPAFAIITIDPTDPLRVFLRGTNFASDRVLRTTDGGKTWTVVFEQGTETVVTAFLRRQDGTILMGARTAMMGLGFRSTDGGTTFTPWELGGLRLRGLAEKGTRLYAITDNFYHPFSLATSDDGGASWQPLLTYQQIGAITPCARARCVNDCLAYADLGLFPKASCGAGGETPDGGSDGAGEKKDGDGCGCALGDDDRMGVPVVFALTLATAAALKARSRSVPPKQRGRI